MEGTNSPKTRLERHLMKKSSTSKWKKAFVITIYSIFSFMVVCLFVVHLYMEMNKQIEAPKEDLGRKVIIELPKNKKIYTYENLITEENGEIYYEGKFNKIKATGGTITYEEWD